MVADLSSLDPTGRFTNRVANYVKYRPSYPEAVIDFFRETLGLRTTDHIADVGSGTGIFAGLLLEQGYTVTGVEPNDGMRQAAEQQLAGYPLFTSMQGQGEATGLPGQSIDLVTVAQAFHWLDPVATKKEFLRILKPGGHIAVIWNIRQTDTPFLSAYEKLKSGFATDYTTTGRDNANNLPAFFAPAPMQVTVFPHQEQLDWDALKGQLLSASYIPLPGQARHEEMMQQLKEVFQAHASNGYVTMEYKTKVYWGEGRAA